MSKGEKNIEDLTWMIYDYSEKHGVKLPFTVINSKKDDDMAKKQSKGKGKGGGKKGC